MSVWQTFKSMLGLGGDQGSVDASVKALIHVAEPKLELLPGAVQALREGVRRTLAYADELGAHELSPLDLSPAGYGADARIGLMFSSPEVLLATLEGSDALRDYFLSASNPDEAYALLVMQCHRSQRFGQAMRNGQLVDDVAQTVVSFGAHRLVDVCADEASLRHQVARRAFRSVAAVAARRIALLSAQQQTLGTEKMQVELRLATLGGSATVVDALPAADGLPVDAASLKRRLAEINESLAELAPIGTLEGKLAQVRKVCSAPQDFVAVRTESLFLDRMGVLRSPGEGEEGIPLNIETVALGKLQPIERVIVPVKLTRQTLAAWRDRLA